MGEDRVRRVFRFGVFEVSEAGEELRKHGVRIKLHSQPFKVLTMLLDRPLAIVTREEMRQRLWGSDTFVDFDHGLNTAVNKIREALGDSASAPRYVETVAGKGYRFLAPVMVQEADLRVEQTSPAGVGTGGRASVTPAAETREPLSAAGLPSGTILTASDELPVASRTVVRTLLVLIEVMYLGFYLGALANLTEIHEIFVEAGLPQPNALMSFLVTTSAALIPIRLFIVVAVALDFQNLPSKFAKLFPFLLALDLLWAMAPFLLIHHINTGLALGLCAPLVYVPFAQRSLVLIYARRQ